MTDHSSSHETGPEPCERQVQFWLGIDFESCGAYLMTSLADRKKVLDALHRKVITDPGSGKLAKLGGVQLSAPLQKALFAGGFPSDSIKEAASLGLAALSGNHQYKASSACPPGATCRVQDGCHVVTGGLTVLRDGEVWTVQSASEKGLITAAVKLHVQIMMPMKHGSPDSASLPRRGLRNKTVKAKGTQRRAPRSDHRPRHTSKSKTPSRAR